MKQKEIEEALLTISELVIRLYNKQDVLTRQELDLLDKLQDIKEKLK